MNLKTYLIVTGVIFALFAVLHVFELVKHWEPHDMGFTIGVSAVIVFSVALSAWAFRLLQRAG